MRLGSIFAAAALGTLWAAPEVKVTALKFRCEPVSARIRPYENAVLQIQVSGESKAEDGSTRTGRLRKAAKTIVVATAGGGWTSKPFKFQGSDSGEFIDQDRSNFRGILSGLAGEMLVQDSVLYTAPEKPGKYTLEAELEGVKASFTIEVAADAPTLRKPEKASFPKETAEEPYRALAEHWSPMLAQETWFTPKADYPTRFDYDGDLAGDNNWDRLDDGTSQAYVYYAAIETSTHWFLIYNAFHPRDYSDKCLAGTCHENDNEGLILTVRKDGSQFGKLQAMETLAHNNVYSYIADEAVRSGLHNLDGPIEFHEQTHPVVFIESGGHGIYGSTDPEHSAYKLSSDEFRAGTGVTFIYKGAAERPRHANDRLVGYDLLPIYQHWWLRVCASEHAGAPRLFDDYGPYAPYGGRPRSPCSSMGRTFLGRKMSSNKAKPFWGWHDVLTQKRKALAAGQWGLDPAYGVSRNLRFPGEFSLDYIHNPYLGVNGRGQEITPATPPSPAAEPATAPQPAAVAEAPALPEIAARQSAGGDSGDGWFEIRAAVDGTAILHVRGSGVFVELLSGQPVQNAGAEYSQPLPAAPVPSLSLEKRAGRGGVTLLERPSELNGFTAKIRVDDPRGGSDRYAFRLRWAR